MPKPLLMILGTGSWNKGAELMAVAAAQWGEKHNFRKAVDVDFGDFESRQRHGLLTLLQPGWRRKGLSQRLPIFSGSSFRDNLGIVLESEIDLVFDASGYAYGDTKWGRQQTSSLARASKRWKNNGIRSILLPQAYGPFEDQSIKSEFAVAAKNIDLVFARDNKSLRYLEQLVPGEKLRLAPDFTNLVSALEPDNVELPEGYGCIVPNVRMIDQKISGSESDYLRFLARCIESMRSAEINPIILLHEQKDDLVIGKKLAKENDLPLVCIADPREVKGVIQKSELLVGSRFHSLVSSLSQGVPCIGTSWSHKYEELFADYEHNDFLVLPNESPDKLQSMIRTLVVEKDSVVCKLSSRAEVEKEKTVKMWQSVSSLLGI